MNNGLDMAITNQIEQIAQEMCEKYCKYPDQWDEEAEGMTMVDAICNNCPLDRLEEIHGQRKNVSE